MRELSWKALGLLLLTLVLLPSTSRADLYVANADGASVTVYAPSAIGNSAPSRTIAGVNTGFNSPETLFADTVNNELYVADFFGKAIRVFPLNANGNVAPTRTLIDGPNSQITQVRDMVVDTVNNELIVETGSNSIRVFPRTASGDALPVRTISGPNTLMNNPVSIAFDAVADELFVDSYDVAGPNLPGILVFNRTDSGNVAPKRFIAGSNTQFGTYTNYVTVDRVNGELLAEGDDGPGVVVFNLTDAGNVAPKRNLTGASTGLTTVGGIIVDDANNRLIATNRVPGSDSVRLFSRTANGNTAPVMVVSGPATGLSGPFGLALDAAGGLVGIAVASDIPALTWEGLLALVLMMALLGAAALQRMQ